MINDINNEEVYQEATLLIKFRDELHTLLSKYPDVRIAGDADGDVLAYVPSQEWPRTRVYMPRSGKQELIKQITTLTANGVPVSL